MTVPNTTAPTTNSDGQIVVTPQTFAPAAPVAPPPPNNAVTEASERARALIATQGTVAAPEPGTTTETPRREAGSQPGAQPRASDGTFGTPLPPDPNAAPAAGPDGQSEAAPAEGAEPPAEGDEAAQRIVEVALPDGTAVDLDLGDPIVADVVRAQIETARDAEAIRTEAETQLADLVSIRESIQIDPVGFAMRELAESPAGQEHLVLSLLTQPELFERLKPQIEGMLHDPRNLELARAQQVAARSQFAEQARHEVAEQRAVSQNLKDVQTACAAIARLLPNEAVQATAYNDMLRDLMTYAQRANVLTIEPDYIPAILASRLTALGLNPVEAAQRASEARTRRGAPTRPRLAVSATPKPGTSAAPAAGTPRPAPNGQQFVDAQQRRKAVAIPAGGAGSPGVGSDLVPPKKADGSPMSTAETLAWHREQVAKGRSGIARAG